MKQKIWIIFLLSFTVIYSQNKGVTVEEQIDQIAQKQKGLEEVTQLDVSGLTLFEIITSLAEEHKISVDVDPQLNQMVISNFFDVKVKDVFLFLIRKYDLDVQFMNSIIVFKKRKIAPQAPKEVPVRQLDIDFNKANEFLSVKLKEEAITDVAAKITELSNKNVVLAPDVKTMQISAYIINRPFDQVIDMIAKSNQLVADKDENGFYFLSKDDSPATNDSGKKKNKGNRRRTSGRQGSSAESGDMEIKLNQNGFLYIKAFDASATEIVTQAAELLGIDYAMYDRPDEIVSTISSDQIDFDTLLDHIFRGKKYTVNKSEEFYLIGKETSAGLRTSELIQLENRTIESVLAALPKSLTQDLDIQEFVELNGMLVSGSKPIIEELALVIRKLDKVVPLVQIEVIIVQYQKGYTVQTGLQAILDGSQEVATSGSIFPSTDVTVNSSSINQLIDAFNGLGVINIGKVTKDFYANLSALESNSIVRLKSTPKIATLSGHEANLSIGETSYYFEQNNRLINSGVNNNILQSGQWKPTEANLSVNIKPFVSLDEHVTLEIAVEKSSFLGRAGENAPPGKSTQKFESLIRVKNNEMILLGGLDELEKENSGTGTPFLSRIPVIKWFFSSRRKVKDKSKLHLFIKPSVVY